MRVVSMDEASNLFRASFCHGDASLCHGDASFATATRPFKMCKKCRKHSAHAPELESGKADSAENRIHSTPNQIARFKLPSSKRMSFYLYHHLPLGVPGEALLDMAGDLNTGEP